jgi:hypothetical protein
VAVDVAARAALPAAVGLAEQGVDSVALVVGGGCGQEVKVHE